MKYLIVATALLSSTAFGESVEENLAAAALERIQQFGSRRIRMFCPRLRIYGSYKIRKLMSPLVLERGTWVMRSFVYQNNFSNLRKADEQALPPVRRSS